MSLTAFLFILTTVAYAVDSAPTAEVPNVIGDKALNTEPELTIESSLKMRDPFQRPKLKLVDGSEGGRIPPLQRFSTEEFRLVGVISGTKKNKAMLSGPDGKLHIVTEEAKIGTRKGVVKHIEKNHVIVEEKVINILGQEEKSETSIEFKDANKGTL